jgi:hypothetical protein
MAVRLPSLMLTTEGVTAALLERWPDSASPCCKRDPIATYVFAPPKKRRVGRSSFVVWCGGWMKNDSLLKFGLALFKTLPKACTFQTLAQRAENKKHYVGRYWLKPAARNFLSLNSALLWACGLLPSASLPSAFRSKGHAP